MNNLKIAIPKKGRLKPLVVELLAKAGFQKVTAHSNHLFIEENFKFFSKQKQKFQEIFVEFIFLRADDIPEILDRKICDLGITGSDILLEQTLEKKISAKKIAKVLSLDFGHCNLCLAIDEKEHAENFKGIKIQNKRIATSFPHITKNYYQQKNISVDIVKMSGSVETSIRLNIADAIVDLVQTGNTLAANRLVDIENLFFSETCLYANEESYSENKEAIDFFQNNLQGIILAYQYSILEYNVQKKYLEQAKKITSGYNSPTVSFLDKNWCSIKVMVKKEEIIKKIEQLQSIYVEAIFETEIKNCRL